MNSIKINVMLTIILFVAIIVQFYLFWVRSRKSLSKSIIKGKYDYKDLNIDVIDFLTDTLQEKSYVGMSKKQILNENNITMRIRQHHEKAQDGNAESKNVMQDFIKSHIGEVILNDEECDIILGDLSPRIKWEIILYRYKKIYNNYGLNKIIEKYSLDSERIVSDEEESLGYYIDDIDIINIYNNEDIVLNYQEKIDLLAFMNIADIYGYSIMESIDRQSLDGWMIGTSGSSDDTCEFSFLRSCWIHWKGKYIHLRFLKFESQKAMQRVVKLGVRYQYPGELTEKKGYMINRTSDGSRVLGLRSPIASRDSLILRKHDLTDVLTLKKVIFNPEFKNCEFLYLTLEFIMKGMLSTVFTGAQGSGKTTFLRLLVEFISPKYTIRSLETIPELFLSIKYPYRNIVELYSSTWVGETELQDASKKSDGKISILGEVSTDALAANYVKSTLVAYLQAMCTHHANTPEGLVTSLTNSLISEDGQAPVAAERNVVDAIRVNVHQKADERTIINENGDKLEVKTKRYTQRITEIVPIYEKDEFPQKEEGIASIFREYAVQTTQNKQYICKDIIVFNPDKDTYEPRNCFSDNAIEQMISKMTIKDRDRFKDYLQKYFNKNIA